MLGIDARAARAAWTAVLVLLLVGLVYLVRRTLFVFILAVLFAYLLAPLVNLLDRSLPASRTRTPALALAYAIFVGAVVLVGAQIGSRVIDQANRLAKDLPSMLQSWAVPAPDSAPWINQIKQETVDRLRSAATVQLSDVLAALPQAGVKFLSVASDLVYVVVIPILSFFFLKDSRSIRWHLLDLLHAGPQRAMIDEFLVDIDVLLAHYMRALVLLSLASFTAYSICFSIIGMPYAVLLGTLGGLLEFIPMVGPLTAGAAILVIAIVTGSHALAVLVFLLAYRVLQDYVLSPHLMGRGVDLHPVLVLFGVFAGAEIAGIPGTFLSVPVLAMARILYLRIRKARLEARLAAGPVPVDPAG